MEDATLDAAIAAMPKVELHMHLEGALEPEMLFALAARNGVDVGYESEEALRQAYAFTNLQSFLDLYYAGLRVLLTERDFYDMTLAYLRRVRQDNVVHAEVFVSPQAHTRRGVAFAAMFEGIAAALADGARDFGMTAGLILGFQRHLPEDSAFETLRAAEPYAHRILGFGLGGAELGNPPAKFARVFAAARAAGHRLVCHAGEEGPAAYVAEALDLLKVDRVDHGVRSIEDADLVRRLADTGVPLTVCPVSNIALRVYDRMEDHPLARLLRAGVKVTVNSDDPPYFGGYMTENFIQARAALSLTASEIRQLAENAVAASFAYAERRAALGAELAAFWDAQR